MNSFSSRVGLGGSSHLQSAIQKELGMRQGGYLEAASAGGGLDKLEATLRSKQQDEAIATKDARIFELEELLKQKEARLSGVMKATDSEHDVKNQHIKHLKDRITELEEQNRGLMMERENYAKQTSVMAAQLEEKMNGLVQQIQSKDANIKVLQEQLVAKDGQLSQSASELAARIATEMGQRMHQFKEKLEATDLRCQEAESEHEKLRELKEKAEARVGELEAQLEERMSTIGSMREVLSSAEAFVAQQVAASTRRIEENEAEHKLKIASLEGQLKSSQDAVEKLQAQCVEARPKQEQELEAQRVQYESQVAELQLKCRRMEGELKSAGEGAAIAARAEAAAAKEARRNRRKPEEPEIYGVRNFEKLKVCQSIMQKQMQALEEHLMVAAGTPVMTHVHVRVGRGRQPGRLLKSVQRALTGSIGDVPV
ncbi:hypothetical protein CYMTET_9886 [Cymbomonas tetramitiformis]|uniref:Uncharacterized protein n=1 Tax=Cymbomonas tetramitiformis TaxID=36881 RepID=A0AAE0GQR1_9CHLO|nr:hypothetical protein CYMTET_9886 [Cymbomonas tetramitiformis]